MRDDDGIFDYSERSHDDHVYMVCESARLNEVEMPIDFMPMSYLIAPSLASMRSYEVRAREMIEPQQYFKHRGMMRHDSHSRASSRRPVLSYLNDRKITRMKSPAQPIETP